MRRRSILRRSGSKFMIIDRVFSMFSLQRKKNQSGNNDIPLLKDWKVNRGRYFCLSYKQIAWNEKKKNMFSSCFSRSHFHCSSSRCFLLFLILGYIILTFVLILSYQFFFLFFYFFLTTYLPFSSFLILPSFTCFTSFYFFFQIFLFLLLLLLFCLFFLVLFLTKFT